MHPHIDKGPESRYIGDNAGKFHAVYEIRYRLEGHPPNEVSIQHDMLKERDFAPGHPWHVEYATKISVRDGPTLSATLASGVPLVVETGYAQHSTELAALSATFTCADHADPHSREGFPSWCLFFLSAGAALFIFLITKRLGNRRIRE